MKNQNSYLAGGIKDFSLVEDDEEIFAQEGIEDFDFCSDIVYHEPSDSYFYAAYSCLYRKDINGESPYPVLSYPHKGGGGVKGVLGSSKGSKRLILEGRDKNISIFNPKTRKKELTFNFSGFEEIRQFCMVGEDGEKFAVLSNSGCIFLFNSSLKNRGGDGNPYFCSYKIRANPANQYFLMTSCSRGEYLLVENSYFNETKTLQLLKIEGDEIAEVMECNPSKFKKKEAKKYKIAQICCFGYNGSHLLFLCLPSKGQEYWGNPFLVDFDLENNQISILNKSGKKHQARGPTGLCKGRDYFYYSGQFKLMRMKVWL